MGFDDIDEPLYSIEDDEPLYDVDVPDETFPHDEILDDDDEDDDDEDLEEDDDDVEEEEATAEPEAEKKPKKLSPMLLMLLTMIGPVDGWKSLKRARLSTDSFASRCFYPLIALAAVTEAASLFYEANYTISDWAMDGLFTFMTFFFGYFTILLAGAVVLPAKSRHILKKDVGKQFVMLAMSTLAIFWSLIQLFPMFEPVLVFLPLWTIYIIFKGVRILRVPKDVENSTTGLICMLVIGVPIFWYWLLTEVFAKLI